MLQYSLYISIITCNWYFYDTLVKYILNNKFRIFIIQDLVYWIIGLTYMYINKKEPSIIKEYKIDNKRTNRLSEIELLPVVIKNHIISGLCLALYGSFTTRGLMTTNKPSLPQLYLEILAIFAGYDIIFYIGHRIIHHPLLYSRIHKMHHTTYANSAISGHYMGSVDYILEFILPFFIPIYLLNEDVLLFYTFCIIAQINGLVSHSGYNLPFTPYDKTHLYHHLYFDCNYGVFFMDYLFSTEK